MVTVSLVRWSGTSLWPMGDTGNDSDQAVRRGSSTDDDTEAARHQVVVLLAAAGLDPPPDEVGRLAGLYPGLRRSLDRFHAVDTGDEVTAAVFRATEAGPSVDDR